MTKAFGGVTITSGAGTWLDNNKLYEDKNYIFSCNYANKLTSSQKQAIIEVINLEFNEGGQLGVSVMNGNSLIILDKSDMQSNEFLAA